MKNIIYPFMTMVAAAAALVSCTHKETEVVDKTGYEYRFVIAETDTRATLDNEGVKWEVGDQVGVFLGEESTSANAPVNATDTPKTITVTSAAELSKVYAYYPYNAANAAGAASATVVFPASQVGGSVSAMPMAGIPTDVVIGGEGSANGVIHFVNLGSIIDFRVYSTNADYANETVESITFNATGMAVSGGATLNLKQVSFNENTVSVPDLAMTGGDGSSSATVTQSLAVAASKAAATTPIYLVVAPGTYTGTIVVNTNAASYTFTYTEKALSRNKIKQFSMNLGSSNVEREAFPETTYNLVTNALSAGTYILVSDDSNYGARKTVALFPTVVTTSWSGTSSSVENGQRFNEKDVTLSGNSIITTDSEIVGAEIKLVESGSGWKIMAKATGEYLVTPTASYRIPLSTNANDAAVFSISTAQNRSITVGGYYFFHSGSATGFTIRNTGNTVSNVRFYKKVKLPQTLFFSEATATYDLKDGTWTNDVPTLDKSGAVTTVTYTSSNPAVAEVDPTLGTVTIPTTAKKGNTAIITATAEETEEYDQATASYTITIVDTTPVVATTFYKADEMEAGKVYLIVSNGYALRNNNGTVAAEQVQPGTGDTVQFAAEGTDLWTATANGSAFTLTNNEKFLRRSGSSLAIGSASTTASNNQWTYDAEYNYVMSGTYYLYYSTGNSVFSISTSQSESHVAALYTTTPPLPAWEIAFNVGTATYDKYTSNWTTTQPALTTNATTVTYASSDETVATVSSTGAITALKTGTTTITATAAADASHSKTKASYTLTVVDTKPATTFYKADEMEAGKEYLIVSNGYALRNNNGSVAAVQVQSGPDDTVQFAEEGTDLWTATADGNAFRLTNNGKYLLLTSSSSWSGTTYSLSIDNASTTAANNQWTYNSVEESLKVSSRYVYVNNSAFTTSSSFDSNKKAALYSTTPPLPAWEIAFNVGTATYDKYTSNWTTTQPALTTNATTVTYASSNEWVATVSSTGAITAHRAGTTIITATAAADANHKKSEASYTLTVVNSDSTPRTYTRISGAAQLVTGTYLIVEKTDTYVYNASGTNHGGYGTIGTTEGISKNETTITLSSEIASSYEFVFTRTDDNLTIQPEAGEFAGKYMYATANVTSTYIDFQAAVNNFTINSQEGDLVYFRTAKGNSQNEYLYKKSTDSFFKLGGSGAPGGGDAGIYLYKKND